MKKKRRVLVFTTSYLPYQGGAEIAVREITRRLKERFDFFIITSRLSRTLREREKVDGVTVIRVGFGSGLDKYLLPFLGFLAGFKMRKSSLFLGVDISFGSLAALIVKLSSPGTPFVLNVQYGESEERLSRGRFGFISIAFWLMLKKADYVTVISTYLLDLTRAYGYQGLAEVVPNGVDIEKFQSFKPKSEKLARKVIITTSRLAHKNGLDVLIQAVGKIKERISEIECWIVGDGPKRKDLEEFSATLGLGRHIKFFGGVPHEKIPGYLCQADLFVRPSRSEGMGNSFVEAMAVGIPVIGTKVGGIPDIIQDEKTGLFCEVDDSDDLASNILRILYDEELSSRLVQEGENLVRERFSWRGIAGQYDELFCRLLPSTASGMVFATPLFPPQIGGPAQYVSNLSKALDSFGYRVRIVSFGKYRHLPPGARHFLYFFHLLVAARGASAVVAFDYTSVGLPAALVAKLLRKPLIIRVEGDFLWESYVERTRRELTLSDFYRENPRLSFKERLWRVLGFWVLRQSASNIFSSQWRKNMFDLIGLQQSHIVRNVWPAGGEVSLVEDVRGKVIVFAGRMLFLKNLQRLIRTFARLPQSGFYELHLVGDGPERKRLENFVRENQVFGVRFFDALPNDKLLDKLKSVRLLVVPSLSEVGPQVVCDAMRVRTSFLMTSETGFIEYLGDREFFFDPRSEDDLLVKMRDLLLRAGPARVSYQGVMGYRGWPEVARDWDRILRKIV